ncbi:MAG TPA: class I SAM-dependent methyltransferase [Candidatus Paceibacterota bacterium]|nr:class I SAM-dependent methyltransferase [Candidatus Paceibacterota bacterium]
MFKKLTRPQLEAFITRYGTEERILDVGSGGSAYSRYFPNRVTVDIDPARHPEIVADAHALPFKEDEFSLVLCTEMLEHTKHPEIVARELMRVLKPGGTLVLTTRFVYPLHDTPNDFFRFTKYGLRELFSQWTIVEERDELRDFSTLAALMQRIGFQTRLRGGRTTKALLYFFAWLVSNLDWLVAEEYGDIRKSVEERNILSTGVYVAVRKERI